MICAYWYVFRVTLKSAPRYVYAMRPGRKKWYRCIPKFNYKINVTNVFTVTEKKCVVKLQLLKKMLKITKEVTSEYFHTLKDLIDFFPKLL